MEGMKLNKMIFVLIGFVLSINLFAQSSQTSRQTQFRIIETSSLNAKYFLKDFPNEIKIVKQDPKLTILMVPWIIVPKLSATIHKYTGHCGGFIDVTIERTNASEIKKQRHLRQFASGGLNLPQLPQKREDIVKALNQITPHNIKTFVDSYSGAFTTRVATSDKGSQAPKWLAAQWQKMAQSFNRSDIQITLVDPPKGYNQNSVRILIPGSDPKAPAVVLGAHLDSINQNFGTSAPGADDDASGIAALTEVYRVLLANNIKPRASIHIFGYAAEELGLYGSRAIAEAYSAKQVPVRGVLQLDMVAYPGSSRSLTFYDDFTSKELSVWSEQLYGMYVGLNVKHDQCGYGCSDHASWDRFGYPAIMPFESPFDDMNHRIHTKNDVWDDKLDEEFAGQFAKLAYAFTVYLSE